MTLAELDRRICAALYRMAQPRFTGTVSQWCEQNIRFNEPGRVGKFSFYGREYLRDPLNFYGDDSLTDMVLCFGTRTGKTTVMFGGAIFRLLQKARRMLFVHPASHGAAGACNVAKTRFIPILRASEVTAQLIPSGARRFDFTQAQQMLLNGSIADWVGSNSVGQLASNSMEDVNQDETDKFNVTRRRDSSGNEVEADSSKLADERTAEFRNPKRTKASTPTLAGGRIWTSLMETDLRRRFVPCPLCGRDHPKSKLCVIVWSATFTVLPRTYGPGTSRELNSDIPTAFVEWDKEARRADGSWDYDRVERSAGYRCPHCGGRFRDEEKVWADANGAWEATQRGAARTAGYHLPSWYSNHDQTTAGMLASDFLKSKRSPSGLRNFINSKCAEPYMSQDMATERIEIVRQSQIEITAEWKKVLTVDAQQKWPYFWFIVRAWNGGNSEGVQCGMADTVDELRAVQIAQGIPDAGVLIDSGYGAMREAEIYRECVRFGELRPRRTGFPIHIGWMPCKGFPKLKRWPLEVKNAQGKLIARHSVPYYLRAMDPFRGTTESGKIEMSLFEFSSKYYEDILASLRNSKLKHGYTWGVSKEMDAAKFDDGTTYWKHMDGHILKRIENKFTGLAREEYCQRHRDWPDHLLDCEISQVAAAHFFEFFNPEIERKKPE